MGISNIILAAFFPIVISGALNTETIQFIKDYYTHKNIKAIATFTCSKHDAYLLAKTLTNKFWIISADYEKPITKFIDPVVKRSYSRFGLFMDYDCPEGKQYLFQNSMRKSLNGSYYWLIWSNQMYGSDIENINLNIDTEMTWAYPDPDENRTIMYDLYKINYMYPINGTLAGFWDSERGIRFNLTQYKYARRQDLQGIKFTAGIAVNNIPTENLKEELVKPENRKMDAMATYNYRIFDMLQQTYNFTVDIVPSKYFGYVVENGKLEGLTLMMKNHEVDFSVSAILINRARYRCMDFVPVPTWEFRIEALFRHPPVTGYYGQVLLQPFETNVWWTSGVMWIIVIVIIRFVSWVEIKTYDFVATSNEEETVRSWSDTLMIMIGAISEQGTTMDSKWIAWRISFLAAFILSMMVNINYGVSLVSSLLSTPPKSIKTTRNLIDSQLAFGAEDISYNVAYFALNSDPLVHELYQKKMAPPNNRPYYSRDEALKKMRKERFAFHCESLKVFPEIEDTFSDKQKCELTEILIFPPEKCYLAIPWGSPYKEAFSIAMQKAHERGLISYADRTWKFPKPACTIKEEFVSVEMDKIFPAFLIVAMGVFLSFIMLVFEKLIKKRSVALEELNEKIHSLQENAMHLAKRHGSNKLHAPKEPHGSVVRSWVP